MRMNNQFSKSVPKKATNITLSLDVYNDAKRLGINISQTCEELLRETIRREKERRWGEEHAAFIAAYNRTVEAEGLPLGQWRTF
jgi:antitoxin CcdA